MAGSMMKVAVLLIAVPQLLLLSACVSTEELYARYDDADCVFTVERDDSGVMTLREMISNNYYPWEPAVYFAYDSAELAEADRQRLARSVTILQEFPQLMVALQGFTDRIGSHAYNQRLAARRVASVAQYLQSLGVDASRMTSQPIGKGLPVIGNDDDAARASNRRVELMLLDEQGRPLHPAFSMDDA